MNVAQQITSVVNRFPEGFVFGYDVFGTPSESKEAVIKALNRMAAAGHINKLSKGRFYKPEQTVFGDLEPSLEEIVKDLLEDDGKTTGYLTGLSVYNKLGFTSQVSNSIQIGKNEIRPSFQRGRYSISFLKQKNVITKENIKLLQLLDVLRFIGKIPDTTIQQSIQRFMQILTELEEKDVSNLQRLAMNYRPSVRALLGAISEQLALGDTKNLYKSLNPITVYNFNGAKDVLANTEKWNIK